MTQKTKSGGLGGGLGGGTGLSTNLFSDDWELPSIVDPSLFNTPTATDWTDAAIPEFKMPDFKITDEDISAFLSKQPLGGGNPPPGNETSWWSDSGNLSAMAGLAGALTQAIALPEQLKNMKIQRKSMEHNLATAKEEQARRNKSINSFNSFKNIKGA